MKKDNVWTSRDARVRLSELVRKARAGAPQIVTTRGKDPVVFIDPERFDIRPKPKTARRKAHRNAR
jgi:prevent-host-death family protein